MNLYLVPAAHENLKQSVLFPVHLSRVQDFLLTSGKLDAVKAMLGERQGLFCWATTEASRSTFESMVNGDVVLFSVKEANAFRHAARVFTTLESREMGAAIWLIVPREKWDLIYIFDRVAHFDMPNHRLLEMAGYPARDIAGISRVQRIRRLTPERLQTIRTRFGSVESFVRTLVDDRLN